MGYYTNITELPPVRMPSSAGTYIFRWTDDYTGKLYQLYINGKLANETRQVSAGKNLTGQAVGKFSWQILAIDPASAGTDYSDYLDVVIGSRVKLKWPRRSTDLEYFGYVNVFWDAGVGTIITTSSINRQPIMNFPPGAGCWGHGLGPHGYEAHGYEGEGIGHGYEAHGIGGHGFGCDYVEFVTEAMPPGEYKFRCVVYDVAGNATNPAADETVLVDCPPVPPTLAVKSYTSGTDALVLTVTAGTERVPY